MRLRLFQLFAIVSTRKKESEVGDQIHPCLTFSFPIIKAFEWFSATLKI